VDDASPKVVEVENEVEEDIGYTWKQTLQDVSVNIQLKSGLKSKELVIKFTPLTVLVQIKATSEVLMKG